MNEMTASGTEMTTKLVLRRTGLSLGHDGLKYDASLADSFRFLGVEWPPWVWWLVLSAVLLVALFYVVWMYVKDSRGVGVLWAILLGSLRLSVYALLALVFLLPSRQTFI